MNLYLEYYDSDKEWKDDKPGWPQVIIRNAQTRNLAPIIEWVYLHIDNPERHVRWRLVEDTICFKFRYERDYILFTLRWS